MEVLPKHFIAFPLSTVMLSFAARSDIGNVGYVSVQLTDALIS
ncbi:hypothetical protein M2451_003714 [Dysgonomonas sp. PFB1-18]|nr:MULTISPECIES: hypothetical protein [unclassified Dysgonomonas]MDH6310442.1 hypothetical protein [Dysgonomonas sp. PF1-14]MDH6340753.1 hypothetical protein [Dysgonomonas sp. PF1-16]MDH6382373.1 hypothetical protein [Dysgonomonas sp. PFB1-18]MDH6399726.1 hypothetical protein [Dysgonomonas sp. PF1-23]